MRESISVEKTEPFTEAWKAVARIPEIQTDTCEKLVRSQNDWMELCMEYGARQMQALNGHRDLPESLATQTELMSEYSAKLFECAVDLLDIVAKANAEMISCMGLGVAHDEPAATAAEPAKATPASSRSRRTAKASA
jgi:hypothetical protein